MDAVQARKTQNLLAIAITGVRESVRALRRTPDSILDNEIAENIHALENVIAHMQMLQDECKHYRQVAAAATERN